MPRLLLINGLPGCGKSTVARSYTADHSLSLCVEIDQLRESIGAPSRHPRRAESMARRIALSMAEVALSECRDVVVPRFVVRSAGCVELAMLAQGCAAEFIEVVLVEDRESAMVRMMGNEPGRVDPGRRRACALLDHTGARESAQLMHDRLQHAMTVRQFARPVFLVRGDVDRTYRDVLRCL